MKLISMVDFVIEQTERLRYRDDCEFAYTVRKYASFLKQPLTLGMFVPVDDHGNVLKEPEGYKYFMQDDETGAYDGADVDKCESYQKAKKRVLFKYSEVCMIRSDKDKIRGCSYIDIKSTTLDWLIRFRDDDVIKFIDQQLITIEDVVFMGLELTESATKQFM